MIVTLTFFVVGSVIGAAQFAWWSRAPSLRPISLVHEWGLPRAMAAQLSAFGVITLVSVWLEKMRHKDLEDIVPGSNRGIRRVVQGTWPPASGALALAVLSFVTLAVSGRPWGVTSAFALWGSKAAAALGINVQSWPYWSGARAGALRASVIADTTSVMDFGIMLGALLGAGLAGKFAPDWRIPARSLAAAVLGGLLLGYGARLAYGCNIGAFLGGIASSSLHGWVWFVAALAGTIVGGRLRPLFGLRVTNSPAK